MEPTESTEISREIQDLGAALVGVPVGLLLLFGAWTMWPHGDLRHLEALLAALLAALTGALLLWNAVTIALATLASCRLLPALAKTTLSALVNCIGSPAARRVLARGALGASISLGALVGPTSFALANDATANPPSGPSLHLVTHADTSMSADGHTSWPVPDDLVWSPSPSVTDSSQSTSPSPRHGTANPTRSGEERATPAPILTPEPPEVSPQDSPRTHVVTPGDSLWSIAAEFLPEGATAEDIADTWPRIYAANASVIGENPNLIRPGQVLHVGEVGR